MEAVQKKISIYSTPDSIEEVEVLVDELNKEFSFKEGVYGNILVALTEAVNNSIMHGNKADPAKQVHITSQFLNPYRLQLIVEDEGTGFDYDNLKDPTAPENIENIGGRGVFLIRQLADETIFRENGRIVEMQFNI